ncbi:MAG TPA: alpha/beta hydrolase, partial [Polyangiaceae bacterium]|nr:alpha/beta hydrolase [Polyangiaceae bacterium]
MHPLAALALGYAACTLGAYGLQRAFLYPSPRSPRAPGLRGGQLHTARVRGMPDVHVLLVPGPPGAATVVHFHGNGEQMADAVPLAQCLRELGLGAALVEYPGYGLAARASPSEGALYHVAERALALVRGAAGVDPGRLVLQGQSLGAAVATEMAARGHGRGLILLSPFTSVPALAARFVPVLPLRWMVHDRFDNLAKAPSIALPVLIVHGTRDAVVPAAMGRALAGAFPSARFEPVEGSGHNDLFCHEATLEHVAAFARRVGAPAPGLEHRSTSAALDFEHVALDEGEGALSRAAAHDEAAGELAERGQHADVAAQVEAGQGQRVAPPDQAHLRVQVPGPDVAPRGRDGLVAQEEGPLGELALDDAQAPRLGEHDARLVVVAAHEPELDRAPAAEGGDLLDQRGGDAGRVVHEVAQHDDAAGAGAVERRGEPPEVAAEGAVGQGDAV